MVLGSSNPPLVVARDDAAGESTREEGADEGMREDTLPMPPGDCEDAPTEPIRRETERGDPVPPGDEPFAKAAETSST